MEDGAAGELDDDAVAGTAGRRGEVPGAVLAGREVRRTPQEGAGEVGGDPFAVAFGEQQQPRPQSWSVERGESKPSTSEPGPSGAAV